MLYINNFGRFNFLSVYCNILTTKNLCVSMIYTFETLNVGNVCLKPNLPTG